MDRGTLFRREDINSIGRFRCSFSSILQIDFGSLVPLVAPSAFYPGLLIDRFQLIQIECRGPQATNGRDPFAQRRRKFPLGFYSTICIIHVSPASPVFFPIDLRISLEIFRLRAPVGCPNCSSVVFCSGRCRDVAMATYHKYECKILALLIGKITHHRDARDQNGPATLSRYSQ